MMYGGVQRKTPNDALLSYPVNFAFLRSVQIFLLTYLLLLIL